MADQVFNICKGAFAEKVRDSAAAVGCLLLQNTGLEADGVLSDHDDVAALLAAANTECTATNYSRPSLQTGVVTVDDTNDRVDLDVPDITFTALGNGTNNTLAKAVFYYEEAAADASRIPISHHDLSVTTDGTDLTLQIDGAGIARAA